MILNYIRPLFSNIFRPNWNVIKDVPYGEHEQQKIDLYLLQNGQSNPTIMFIHGGGWQAGDKSAYEGRAKKYALAGFNVVAVNYRLATEDPSNDWPTQLVDCSNVLKYLYDHANELGIDIWRIGVGGDSAGAHLALFFDQAKAILNMFGPTDLTQPDMNAIIKDLYVFNGKSFAEDPKIYESASPIYFIHVGSPPVCTIHGTSDTVVPYNQAIRLKERLDFLQVPNIMVTYDGGHEFGKLPWYRQLYLEMRGLWFFLKYV